MEEKIIELEKRIADLEEQIQNFPKKLTEALRNIKSTKKAPVQEQYVSDELEK